MEESLKGFGVMLFEISKGLDVGSQFAKKPDELHMARGFQLQPSAESDPDAVSVDGEFESIPWIVGRSPSEGGLSSREPKTHKIEPLHISFHETDRLNFCDRVIETIGQQMPWGPAVPLKVSHPVSLICTGGR